MGSPKTMEISLAPRYIFGLHTYIIQIQYIMLSFKIQTMPQVRGSWEAFSRVKIPLFWIFPKMYFEKESDNIVCKYLGEVRPKYLLVFGRCSLNSQSLVILQSGALTQKLYLQWILIICPRASCYSKY